MSEIHFAMRTRTRKCVIGLFSIGACVLLVAVSRQWFHPLNQRVATATASATTSNEYATSIAAEPLPEHDYGQIAQWHLFGKPAAAAPAEDERLKSIPVGRLPASHAKLALTGVVYASNSEARLAIVAHAASKENTYAVGDTLPGEAELHKIERNRIVVRRNERFEELLLPRLGDRRSRTLPHSDAPLGADSSPRAPTGRPFVSAAPAP